MADEFKVSVKVIFIDNEPALALLIAQVFPETHQFYCIFHINQAKDIDRKNISGGRWGIILE